MVNHFALLLLHRAVSSSHIVTLLIMNPQADESPLITDGTWCVIDKSYSKICVVCQVREPPTASEAPGTSTYVLHELDDKGKVVEQHNNVKKDRIWVINSSSVSKETWNRVTKMQTGYYSTVTSKSSKSKTSMKNKGSSKNSTAASIAATATAATMMIQEFLAASNNKKKKGQTTTAGNEENDHPNRTSEVSS